MKPTFRKKEEGRFQRTILLEGSPNQRLELEMNVSPQGGRELTLRELCWGNGVGWFNHKSITLEASQIDSLLKALCCLRTPWQKPHSSLSGCPLTGTGEAGPLTGECAEVDGTELAKVLQVDFQDPTLRAGGQR